ncbi:pirin family protein [Phenylobacterium hankyongense]|nr:pirin-like C-terminal cupin domain-containing protein [Phenylobacterium hankyongense]
MTRLISHVETTAPPEPGFIGEGHTAVEVLRPTAIAASDPFVLLMDDRLDIPVRRIIGGAHPHAGLETVTLILEGSLFDRDEGRMDAGDVVWMTAGRGIIHNEAVETQGRTRILQLWIALPAADRALPPRFQIIPRDQAPVVRGPGAEARLYSGTSGRAASATANRVPVTMIDLKLEPNASFRQDLPGSYNGFVYVLEGAVRVGGETIAAGQTGWFAPSEATDLVLEAQAGGARLVLYAGVPIGEPLIQHGPFVADSAATINDQFRRFRAGEFTRMSQLRPMEPAQAAPAASR